MIEANSMKSYKLLRYIATDPSDQDPSDRLMVILSKRQSPTQYEKKSTLLRFAEKIEQDIKSEFDGKALREIIETNQLPNIQEGESFIEYINRCYIAIPRDENNWIVNMDSFGNYSTLSLDKHGNWSIESSNGSYIEGDRLDPVVIEYKHLGFDNKPIRVGEIVFDIENKDKWKVIALHDFEDRISVESFESINHISGGWFPSNQYSHMYQDTREQIDEDSRKSYHAYWKCLGKCCSECPWIDVYGEEPYKRYNVEGCGTAKIQDLLRRQRELLTK